MDRPGRMLPVAAAALCCVAAVAQPSQGRPAPDEPESCRSIDEIARTLQQIRSDQRALLTIRLIELADRRLAPLRSELSDARGNARSMAREISEMEEMLGVMREQWEREVQGGADPIQSSTPAELDRFQKMIDLRRDELRAEELRAIEAENNLARQQGRVDDLDAKLDELLEMLDERD